MNRTIFVVFTSFAAVAVAALGYDGRLSQLLERIPPLVSVVIQALLAVSVLIGVIDGEWRRWFKEKK